MHPPTEMTEDLVQLLRHPTLYQMLKYSFVGSKQTVKDQIKSFLDETQVNELIAGSAMYDTGDRKKSVRLFAEIMKQINHEN